MEMTADTVFNQLQQLCQHEMQSLLNGGFCFIRRALGGRGGAVGPRGTAQWLSVEALQGLGLGEGQAG